MTASAIVTGASSGLGLELALGIGAGGRAVVGVSRSTPTDARWSELVERGDAQHALHRILRRRKTAEVCEIRRDGRVGRSTIQYEVMRSALGERPGS